MNATQCLAIFSLATSAVAAPLPVAELSRTEAVDFAREIHPILKRNCLACHNVTKAKADLNLESPAEMRTGGESGPAVVPGKSAESLLLQSASHLDEDLSMPPAGNKVKAANCTPEELALIKLWIDQGARGESVAVEKGPLPWRGKALVGPVNAIALSPDGRLAAAARGNRVDLCEVSSGRVLAALNDPALTERFAGVPVADLDQVMSIAFASDELLATGGFRTVRLWRRLPRPVKRDFGALAEQPTALAVSRDGKWAAAGDAKGTIWLWALADEKFEPAQLKEPGGAVTALAFSPDGRALVSATEDKGVRVWTVERRELAFKGESHATIRSLSFLEGALEVIAGCEDGIARVWPWLDTPPAAMPPPLREFKLQDQPLHALTAIAGGSFAWIGVDRLLRIMNASDGKEQRKVAIEHPMLGRMKLLEHETAVAQTLLSSRKARAAAAEERSKKEGESARTAAQALEKTRSALRGKREEAEAAAAAQEFAPGDASAQSVAKKAADALASAEAAFRAAKVNAESGVRLSIEAASEHASASAAVAGAEAAASTSKTSAEALQKLMSEGTLLAKQLVVAPDGGSAMFAEQDGRIQHISLENGAPVETPDRPGLIAFSPSGDVLRSAPDKRIQLASARRPWALHRTIGQADDPAILTNRVLALQFSPDGKLLATGGGTPSRDGELKLWRVTDGTLALHLKKAHADTINSLAFSPDGDLLATAGSDRVARVWRLTDEKCVATLEGHTGHVLSIGWRADGLAVVTGGADRTVRVWDVTTRKQIKSMTNFSGEIAAVSFVGAGDVLLSASSDKSVRLGDQPLPEAASFPFCATPGSTGALVAAGSEDGAIRVWRVSDRKLIRTFLPEER